ncbi:MAG: endo alpha-1,4 polygalactosaminidase [Candidatus Aminicenantes bacterium]|nr:endo alpha-1,4 polygalactosaminidase [Candidatus Aminicenantes bacterium]
MKKNYLLIFLSWICLFILLFVSACKVANNKGNGVTQYTLTVTLGEGLDGSPLNGTYTFNEGETVTYTFSLTTGYWGLEVTLDGAAVSAEGTVTMDRDHTLNAAAKDLGELLGLVEFWGYQIQAISANGAVDKLVNSHYDMLVLEPTRTDWSSGDKHFDTKGMVERLKDSKASDGERRKLIIAYIDIGEAEDWRWYWQWSTEWDEGDPRPDDWPGYILTHDPDGWEGNYPVAYWDSRWKDIIIYGKNQDSSPYGDYNSAIDEVIKAGFDGIYLDWVEAFENDAVIRQANKTGKNPKTEMVEFIREMREYAEQRVPNFIIIQQNASALCDGRPGLFSIIDGIAQEEVWYDGEATDDWNDPDGYDHRVPGDWTSDYLYYLPQYAAAGLPVFNCEYAVKYADDAYSRSYNKGFIPYCTRRSLGRLTTTPPPNYPTAWGAYEGQRVSASRF